MDIKKERKIIFKLKKRNLKDESKFLNQKENSYI